MFITLTTVGILLAASATEPTDAQLARAVEVCDKAKITNPDGTIRWPPGYTECAYILRLKAEKDAKK